MERSCLLDIAPRRLVQLGLTAMLLVSTTGCLQRLLATGAYLLVGPNIEADCSDLEHRRVVVVCRPPASLEYRHAGADRELAKQVGMLLEANVKEIDLVDHQEVEDWIDQKDFRDDDMDELAAEVDAQVVLKLDLESFSLLKGQTLRQGQAEVLLSVYDMEDRGRLIWSKQMDEVLFPANSAVPVQEKSEKSFRRQYLYVLAQQIARHFYDHEPYLDVASDGLAHR